MAGRVFLLAVSLVAACGGASGPAAPLPPSLPELGFTQQGGQWSANPVEDDLDRVSNNGGQYTGEVDRYKIVAPAAGRLQVALTWSHNADFDLILASDEAGTQRLAEGTRNDLDPEYLGISVFVGQTIFVLVVGWEGDPGHYTLETLLLPPGAPKFDLLATPDLSAPWPRNRPIVFTFNQPLDPKQAIPARVLIIATGHQAFGSWCVTGASLAFLPHLPEAPPPFDDGGLLDGSAYTIQFQRGGKGVRALNGEYLDEIWSGQVTGGPYEDEAPGEPPRVTDVDWNPLAPWDGRALNVTIVGQLDPATVAARFERVLADLSTVPLTTGIQLTQASSCASSITSLRVTPVAPPPPKSRIRLVVSGSMRGISGSPDASNLLTGPFPAPGGAGFSVDFTTP